MKRTWDKIIINIVIIVITIILVYFIFKISIIKELISVIFISFLLSYVLRPVQNFMYNKGVNKKIAAIVLILSIIAIIVAFFMFFIPVILKEGNNFYNSIDNIKNSVNEIYNGIREKNRMFSYIDGELENRSKIFLNKLMIKILNSIMSLGENAISLAVIPVLSYYFLSEGELFHNKLMLIIPIKIRSNVKNILRDIDKILSRYVASQFILSIIIGVLTFIVLVCFKVNFPILLSLINALANIIPYFGPIIGAVPPIVIALISSPEKALWVAIFLCIIQQVEGDIISPKIIGASVAIHPIIVILLLILGGKVGGFLGMVLAVPLGVIIKIIYEDINYYLF